MRLNKLAITVIAALTLSTGAALPQPEREVTDFDFSFEGPFGSYDKNQLQRGLKIYTQVCAACHGLQYVPLRTLSDEGGPELPADQMRAYAGQIEVFDPEIDDYRPAKPSDNFPGSTLSNAPDLSVMAKARAGFTGPYGTGINQIIKGMGGPEYIATLLQGYTGEEKVEAGVTLYENTAFPSGWIAMAPPLYGEDVDFDDEHANDLESEAKDVAAFLMWTAEPKLDARKKNALVAIIFLSVFSLLLYLTNKRLWAPLKGRLKKT